MRVVSYNHNLQQLFVYIIHRDSVCDIFLANYYYTNIYYYNNFEKYGCSKVRSLNNILKKYMNNNKSTFLSLDCSVYMLLQTLTRKHVHSI